MFGITIYVRIDSRVLKRQYLNYKNNEMQKPIKNISLACGKLVETNIQILHKKYKVTISRIRNIIEKTAS